MNDSIAIQTVHLRVHDLTRSHDFYVRKLGFAAAQANGPELHLRPPASAFSGAGEADLQLTEDTNAEPAPRNAAGLFHAALLLPNRAALGRWLQATAHADVPFTGFSDHGVSEALYLTDPDGNGLEVYADRPREQWPRRGGSLDMSTDPLDVEALFAAANADASTPRPPILAGAVWGHLHLRVQDLDRSEAFYRQLFGFETMQRYGAQARFLSADGYHHHLGLNTWGGVATARPPAALGLVSATLADPHASAATRHEDPDGIRLERVPLTASTPSAVTGSP